MRRFLVCTVELFLIMKVSFSSGVSQEAIYINTTTLEEKPNTNVSLSPSQRQQEVLVDAITSIASGDGEEALAGVASLIGGVVQGLSNIPFETYNKTFQTFVKPLFKPQQAARPVYPITPGPRPRPGILAVTTPRLPRPPPPSQSAVLTTSKPLVATTTPEPEDTDGDDDDRVVRVPVKAVLN